MPVRTRKGQSLIEVTALLAACLPLVLLLFDGAIYLTAFGLNDSACREVARAVSASCPSAIQKDSPSKSAAAAFELFGLEHGFVHLRKQCVIVERPGQPLPCAPFGGRVSGEVTVSTIADVMLPFCCSIMRRGPVSIESHYTCAYSWSMPSVVASHL